MLEKLLIALLAAPAFAIVACGPDSPGRWTIKNGEGIQISAGSRVSGAVDSVVYGGKEYINACDHGRELQLAVTTNDGECFNPTEAGSQSDSGSSSSSSQLLGINTNGNVLSSTINPAFWMRPGECEASCGCAANGSVVSTFTMSKGISFNPYNVPKSFRYLADVKIPQYVPRLQVESPTAYQNAEFTKFYSVNPQTGALTLHAPPGEGHSIASGNPVIFATQDDQHAMGAISKYGANYYAIFDFSKLGSYEESTTKWSIVRLWGALAAGSQVQIDSYICVGATHEVASCLKSFGNIFKTSHRPAIEIVPEGTLPEMAKEEI
mmetsp:Transcript_27500/g.49529  ORF Transcript_27500/g.49529 Transcript_27500/m.49529 type:complete len:322 (+) Transcript_27500:758-1723(+)